MNGSRSGLIECIGPSKWPFPFIAQFTDSIAVTYSCLSYLGVKTTEVEPRLGSVLVAFWWVCLGLMWLRMRMYVVENVLCSFGMRLTFTCLPLTDVLVIVSDLFSRLPL